MRDCIVVSACMFALARASSVSERQMVAPADAIGGESAEELECVVCMVELENEELFICPGSGSNPHAIHVSCLRKCELKDQDGKKLCPGYTKNWETQVMNIRTKAIKDILMHCSKFKDVPESVNKMLCRAPGAAELKEILVQMVDNFEDLSPIHEQFQDSCKILLEAYFPVSLIYDGALREYTLEKAISEMGNAFEEFKEDKVRVLPKGCQLLVDAPKNIYTKNIIGFMSNPVFFAQLEPKQIVDLGKHLFTFAKDDTSFDKRLTSFFIKKYIYCSSDVLFNSNAFEELLDLTEGPIKLEDIQVDILEGLREYVVNVRLFPDCCERLAKVALTNSRIKIIKKLCILRELGFFTDFTKEMRGRVIDYWKERGIKKGNERALEILHLKDSNPQPQRSSNYRAFELLKKIQGEEEYIEVLELEFYYNMMTCLPDDSFFEEIGRLLLLKRTGFIFSEILPLLPPGELEQRESIVFSRPEGYCGKIFLLPADIVYLYSRVPFEVAFNSFFAFVFRVIEQREIWALELAAIRFGLFFKKDLEKKKNAKLFFDGLRKNDLYVVMPLFKMHFVKMPEYEIYIENNMGNIVKNTGLMECGIFVKHILCALCDTQNEEAHIALCKHFPEYLHKVLEISSYPLFPYILLQRICTESAFSENIESAQIRETIRMFATHDEARPLFGRYMDIFSSCVDARTEREADSIVREFAQFQMSNDRAAAGQSNA